MAPINIDLLLPSISELLAAGQPVLKRYYAHLERLDPRLRYLLPAALPRYVQFALFRIVTTRRIEVDGRGMARLGKRLCDSNFGWSDLDTLMAALLATLQDVLGERFSPEVREEWVGVYRLVRPDSPTPP